MEEITFAIKDGVDVNGTSIEMLSAWPIVALAYKALECSCVLTSGFDGEHMEGSYHYSGDANDFRIWGLEEIVDDLARIVTEELNKNLEHGAYYDVVVSRRKDGSPTNLHVEFDRRHYEAQK